MPNNNTRNMLQNYYFYYSLFRCDYWLCEYEGMWGVGERFSDRPSEQQTLFSLLNDIQRHVNNEKMESNWNGMNGNMIQSYAIVVWLRMWWQSRWCDSWAVWGVAREISYQSTSGNLRPQASGSDKRKLFQNCQKWSGVKETHIQFNHNQWTCLNGQSIGRRVNVFVREQTRMSNHVSRDASCRGGRSNQLMIWMMWRLSSD